MAQAAFWVSNSWKPAFPDLPFPGNLTWGTFFSYGVPKVPKLGPVKFACINAHRVLGGSKSQAFICPSGFGAEVGGGQLTSGCTEARTRGSGGVARRWPTWTWRPFPVPGGGRAVTGPEDGDGAGWALKGLKVRSLGPVRCADGPRQASALGTCGGEGRDPGCSVVETAIGGQISKLAPFPVQPAINGLVWQWGIPISKTPFPASSCYYLLILSHRAATHRMLCNILVSILKPKGTNKNLREKQKIHGSLWFSW